MAEKSLNSVGASHTASLIASGKISDDKSWSAPTAERSDEYIKSHSISEYSKWFLGINPDSEKDTRAHFAYPVSNDFEKISLRGLRAVISRAAQAGAKDIEAKAQELYDSAKAKTGKDGKDRSLSAVTKICLRKASERMARNEVFTTATTAAGYTACDLYRWLAEEISEVSFPVGDGSEPMGCCASAWPVNI